MREVITSSAFHKPAGPNSAGYFYFSLPGEFQTVRSSDATLVIQMVALRHDRSSVSCQHLLPGGVFLLGREEAGDRLPPSRTRGGRSATGSTEFYGPLSYKYLEAG